MTISFSRSFCTRLAAVSAIVGVCYAGDTWPQFLGPNGSATADAEDAKSIPVTWTAKDYNWKTALPGTGYSSPVIWGDKIFLTCANEETGLRIVCCVSRRDGKTLWERRYPSEKHHMHADNSYASSSPAADGKRVYAYWASPEAVTALALTHDGKDVWSRDLGPYKSTFGGGTSPIIWGGMMIFNNDQQLDSFLIALDTATGKTRWQTPRKTEKVPYSTPLLYTREGDKPQLIFASTLLGLTGVDPATGKPNWSVGGPLDSKIRPVGSVVAAGDLLIATWGRGGHGWAGMAVKAGSSDGKIPPTIAYRLEKPMHYSTTPVVAGPWVFACTDLGEMQCIEAATGKKLWTRKEKGGFYGSPVLVGDRIYWTTKTGTMLVTRVGDKYTELGRVDLGEKSSSTPAVVDGVMYIRTFGHLMSLGG